MDSCDRRDILSSQVDFNLQIIHGITYPMTCARTSKSILPPKMATGLISRLPLFPSPHLVLRKFSVSAWGCFGCKQQCCSKPVAAKLTEQLFRKGSIRRRTRWMVPLQGCVHSCFLGGPHSWAQKWLWATGNSLFLTHQVCNLTQAPSQ